MATCCTWRDLRSSGAGGEEKGEKRQDEGDDWRNFMESSMVGNPFSIRLRRIR